MSKLTDAEAQPQNAAVVAEIKRVANSLGVSPTIALATAYQESGFDPRAIGDKGTSFGLFQLHKGGELGSLTPDQAFDPTTNATTALTVLARTIQTHPNTSDPGQLAALAQRPANPGAYANAIDNLIKPGSGGFDPVGSVGSFLGNAGNTVAQGAGTAAGAVESLGGNLISDAIKNLIGSGLVMRATLMVVGLVILFIGLSQLSKGDNSLGETVGGGAQSLHVTVGRARDRAKNAAVKGAEVSAS